MPKNEQKTSAPEAADANAPAAAATAPTGHPGEKLEQPVPADAIPTTTPEAKAAGVKKTADEWAKAKGMLHEFTEGKRGPRAKPKAPPPLLHNPKFVHYHRARHSHGWARNEELTEAQFDAAIQTADSHVYR